MKNICAVHRVNKNRRTCFSDGELKEIAQSMGIDPIPSDPVELYDQILDLFSCSNDRCVSKQIDIPASTRKKLNDALVPMAPREWLKNPTAWLSNHDIDAKVKELIRRRKCEFIGVLPMDAEHKEGDSCVSKNMCEFDPVNCGKKNKSFVAVFNTDYHGLPGTHWVSLAGFLDPKDPRYGVCYYDSTGSRPPRDIDDIVTRIDRDLKNSGYPEIPYTYNDYGHQRSSTECGMFCLAFIESLLRTKRSFYDVCNIMEDDAAMIDRRSIYFQVEYSDG